MGAILHIRGEKVMLDQNLAVLYGVETKRLNKQVKRNVDRFPADFMLQLSSEDWASLRSQLGTSSQWGGTRYPPFVFTEQGVPKLACVPNNPQAIQVNISTMRGLV